MPLVTYIAFEDTAVGAVDFVEYGRGRAALDQMGVAVDIAAELDL